ncbi:MAG: hypothetical protein ACK4I8_11955, partial [Armatimonadota bacterium]
VATSVLAKIVKASNNATDKPNASVRPFHIAITSLLLQATILTRWNLFASWNLVWGLEVCYGCQL